MKTRSIFLSMLFAVTAFVFLTNCTENKKDQAETESHVVSESNDEKEHRTENTAPAEATGPQFQVDKKFQEQLAVVFTSYVELKDAFVATDAPKVQAEAKETKEALAKVDMKLVSGAAHNDWMNYLSPIESALKDIEGSPDIEVQRKSFNTLSDNLYKTVKAFGLGGKQAFYEFCPMAFNNGGGYWLSDKEQIRNPYFGDKMLTCGHVKERLQ
jgi:Cu(I)/Ag(I) efflux system membrane fusion protein